MNRSDFAKAVGISISTVNSWYNRGYQNVSLSSLLKITNYFGITIEQLVYDDTNKNISFSTKDFSDKELQMIKNFSIFLKQNRE
jgi:transcriptional regulator with XRE-family HTH domain